MARCQPSELFENVYAQAVQSLLAQFLHKQALLVQSCDGVPLTLNHYNISMERTINDSISIYYTR